MRQGPLVFLTMMFITLFVFVCANAADRGKSPKLDQPVRQSTFYRCSPGYDPPCRVVSSTNPASTEVFGPATDWPMLIAASQAARSRTTTPVLRGTQVGPIAECGNSHGQSACCRIIAQIGEDIIIECG